MSLSTSRKVGFWLDRRLDPARRIALTAEADSLHGCLRQLASQALVDISWFDCIVYVGPNTSADRIATVNMVHQEQLQQLPLPIRNRWQRRKAVTWEALTTPQELVAALAEEVGVKIVGATQLPHDLWPAAELPPLAAYTRLDLILCGFDQAFVFNGDGSAKLVRMPAKPRFRKRYSVPDDRREAFDRAVAGRNDIELENRGENSVVAASWSVHDGLSRALRQSTSSSHAAASIRYSLRGKNQPVGPLVEQLCQRLELTCAFSDAARKAYDQRVSFEVVQADRDALFKSILTQAQLRHELRANHVRVLAQDEQD